MITTTPVFYYGYTVDATNYYINIDEGSGDVAVELNQGTYSAENFAVEVARAMSEFGAQDYSCDFDRDTRLFTISATSNFDLLISSGANAGLSAYSLLGFSGSDQTSTNSYESGTATGYEYIPQFPLQNYVGSDDWKEYAQANINESASGVSEIYSVGLRSFVEFDIMFATDINQGANGFITTNASGVDDLRSFMQYCITKGDIEFMPDKTDRATYQTLILEKTAASSTGTGYKLNEMYSKGLPSYFETGKLKFRVR